jgi:cytochrome b561
MSLKNTLEAYGSVSMIFHWLTAGAFIAAYVVVYYVIWFVDPDTSIKPALFGTVPDAHRVVPILNIHWILGLTIGFLTLPRLLWRLSGPHPAPPSQSRWEAMAADAAHWALYGLLICMPVSGYMTTYDPTSFGLFEIPACRDTAFAEWIRSTFSLTTKDIEDAAWTVHSFLGQWVAWPLVVLHVAAALVHHFVRKDAVLRRMLPRARRGAARA